MGMGEFLTALTNPNYYVAHQIQAQKDSDQRNLDDIMASGYNNPMAQAGQVQVTPGRGTFGSLLQGIGLLGAPEPRALTPYEQFLYQQGQHYKSNQDQQTEQQRQTNLQRQLNTAQDYINTEGSMPPESIMQGIPQDWQSGLENQLVEHIKGGIKKNAMQDLSMRATESLIDKRQQPTPEDIAAKKHLDMLRAYGSMGPSQALIGEYKTYMNAAMKTEGNEKSKNLSAAQNAIQKLTQYYQTVGAGQLTPQDVQILAGGLQTDPMEPFNKQGDSSQIVQDPQRVIDALKMMGITGGGQ